MTDRPNQQLSLGFSPCPNDTFVFHALVHGLASEIGRDTAPPVLADVEDHPIQVNDSIHVLKRSVLPLPGDRDNLVGDSRYHQQKA